MNKSPVTEQDIRLPQFRDAKLEDLEFDGSGEVVRKDRFEKSMRKIQGILHGINGLSSGGTWTCDQVVGAVDQLLRFKRLVSAVERAPCDAEYYHYDNDQFIKQLDLEHLQISHDNPDESHLINHFIFNEEDEWEESSAWIEYINVLMSIDDMKKEIADFGRNNNANS